MKNIIFVTLTILSIHTLAEKSQSALGYAVYSTADTIRIIDLETQNSTELRIKNSIWPSYDGSEWATYDTTRRYSHGSDDFITYDRNGVEIYRSDVRRSIHGKVQISPDKKWIAAFWSDESNGESYTNPSFTIFDREIYYYYRNVEVGSFAWFPNGDLAVSYNSAIYRMGVSGEILSLITKLPKNAGSLNVSRDGSKLAFQLRGEKDRESHIWVVNTDGTELRQVTTSTINEVNPVWVGSDSKQLLVTEGWVSLSTGFAACPRLFLVSAIEKKILDLSKYDEVGVKQIQYRKTPTDKTLFNACPFSPVAWTL